MRRPSLPMASATAIGSLPHTDPVAAALLVLDVLPSLPAAPSLPARHPAEGMLAQLEAPLDGDGWEALRTFLSLVAAVPGAGPVKLQLTGPLTAALGLMAEGHSPGAAVAVAAERVRQRATEVVALAAATLPAERGLVVFLDEPGLTAWPRADFPLRGGVVADLLSGALASLGPDVVTGVHCCGRTDWQLVSEVGPDVLSLPIDAVGPDDAEALGRHLERDGWIAWGAVPTDGPVAPSPDSHWRHLVQRWCALAVAGCDARRIRQQALLTPACGLAAHTVAQAELVLRTTVRLAERVLDQALATRLSIGA